MRDARSVAAAWRRLGPRAGAAAAFEVGRARVRAPLRRARLRVRPPRVGPGELARALGGVDPQRALREWALPALPTVAAWERELDAVDQRERACVLSAAEQVLAHRFDLLGSGPTDLGPTIDWQLDFKSGRRWPDAHISRVPNVLPAPGTTDSVDGGTVVGVDDGAAEDGGRSAAPGADIKIPWELARCQHLPLLSAAHRVSGERRFLDELGAQLCSFAAANPVERGAPWSCTMDVAIRAANWLAALCMAMPAAARESWLQPALAGLLLHCRFIRSHLERGQVRGNHYLADVVGLLVACAPFSHSAEGRAWAGWAARELEREMAHQVRADGCDHEASIAYHRLVCELFVCGTQAADALCPGTLSGAYRERLERMLGFVRDYTRPDGLAPQIGDADDGRFLPLGNYKADPRDHRHLYAQAGRRWRAGRGHAAYREGGWYAMRHGALWAIVRCGDVGMGGIGAHAHNDQLSFELAFGEQPLVVDPGSYLYTADPRARNELRSTLAHSTLSVGGAEQSRFRPDRMFELPEEANARCLRFETDGPRAVFEGEHTGFRALRRPAKHRRTLYFDGDSGVVRIVDLVLGARGEELSWSFPLAPGSAKAEGSRALAAFADAHLEIAEFAGAQLEIEAEGAALEVASGWISPSYGVKVAAPVVRARRVAESDREIVRFRLTVRGMG